MLALAALSGPSEPCYKMLSGSKLTSSSRAIWFCTLIHAGLSQTYPGVNNAVRNVSASPPYLACGEGALLDVSRTCCYCPLGLRQIPLKPRVESGFKCEVCRAGTFNDVGCGDCCSNTTARAYECTPCEAGYFSHQVGATSAKTCVPCGSKEYTDVRGSTGCSLCPSNSAPYRYGTSCQCSAGTYAYYTDLDEYVAGQEGRTASKVCRECPEGGVCPGNDLIVGMAGFWRPHVNATTFYPCRAGVCHAEHANPYAVSVVAELRTACAEGHNTSTPMCGVCFSEEKEEVYFQGPMGCERCSRIAPSSWIRGLVLTLLVVAALLSLYATVLWPLGHGGERRLLEALAVRLLPREWFKRTATEDHLGALHQEGSASTGLAAPLGSDVIGTAGPSGSVGILKLLVTSTQIVAALAATLNVGCTSALHLSLMYWHDRHCRPRPRLQK
ncbi:hypothetical protein CYMTET_34477 [Cymbomonas tetramitiformis]|uniref:Tyrosine-protein kinase ephrin type A/B receptor-like domain-containing protein n=1 Tax=Cymbomonas tetramitiformis TaxID=36881 RepID=A0AAE0FB64_9CHLO|nr:hypothetical protein CYMTET_34477 [Cymbomonas tetramitiformis]